VDAVAYAQSIEKRLESLVEDPYLSSGQLPPTPDDFMIRARMFLVAPSAVACAFNDLALAWELSWNLNGEGLDEMIRNITIFRAKRDDKDVMRVANALKELKSLIRPRALGALE
jgi:hypothetical protein